MYNQWMLIYISVHTDSHDTNVVNAKRTLLAHYSQLYRYTCRVTCSTSTGYSTHRALEFRRGHYNKDILDGPPVTPVLKNFKVVQITNIQQKKRQRCFYSFFSSFWNTLKAMRSTAHRPLHQPVQK